MMTRPSIPWPTLESRIAERMAPVEAKRPHVILQWLWAYLTFLTGLGMVLGFMFGLVFILPVVAVFRRGKR